MKTQSTKIPDNVLFCYTIPSAYGAAIKMARENRGCSVAVLLPERHMSQGKIEERYGSTIFFYSMNSEQNEFSVVKPEMDFIVCVSDTLKHCV